LVEDGGYSPTFSGDLATEDLADNGGDTQTRSLTSGSPALDAIPAEACLLTTDQRGYARPMMHTSSGTPCYIGAFELGDESPAQGVMQGWAVSAEKDDYGDVGMSDMLVDYRSVALMR
jgi:hypothetical protein